MNLGGDNSVESFVVAARGYCELIQQHATISRRELVRQAHERILTLYTVALHLPDVAPSEDDSMPPRMSHDEWWTLFMDLRDQLRDYDTYWVKHPETAAPENPGRSPLADDLADIYRDLKNGLAIWDSHTRNRTADAVWTWREGFQGHWGGHALNAIHNIHEIIWNGNDEEMDV